MTLDVDVRRGRGALVDLERPWRELFDRAGAGVPFRSLEWTAAWCEHLGEDRVPHVITASEGGRLVGLLALGEQRLSLAGIPVRRLGFLGERISGADYLDVLAEPGREAELSAIFAAKLLETRGFDVLELEAMEAASPLAAEIARRAGVEPAEQFTCPRVDLSGTFPDVLRRGKRGDNFKRRRKALERLPGFSFRRVRGTGEVVAAFDRFLELHERRWAQQGGSDAMGGTAIRAFHRDVVVRLASAGRVCFDELHAGGACRASIYGIEAGDTFCFYQSGYDPDWADRSVGLVCLGMSIEAAQAAGARTYDLLRGTERYKFDWSTDTRTLVGLRVLSRGMGTALLVAREGAESAARAAAHAVLPDAAVELLRRWRRAREHRV